MTGLDELRAELRDLLAGTLEVVPYEHGETVWLECSKACRYVEHTVMKYGGVAAFALCSHPGCSRKAPALPIRYRVTEQALTDAARRALPQLLVALDELAPMNSDAASSGATSAADSHHG